MKVLDLYAGTGSATAGLKARGHDVRHVELFPDKMGTPDPVIKADVWEVVKNPDKWLGDWRPDALWLSPPCQTFSMGGNTHNWYHGAWQDPPKVFPWWGPRFPRTRDAWDACGHIVAALQAIDLFNVPWIMENPRGGLRTMGFMDAVPDAFTVTYCQYGDERMKPTDFWSNIDLSLFLHPACKNGESCHVAAPRGADTGTQGLKDARLRGMVPYDLSVAIAQALESAVR